MADGDVVRSQRLTKRYPGLVALDALDLTIGTRRVFALLGPNGAGKTTAVEIFEGLRRATSGRAEVLGHDVESDYAAIRSRVGVLPQNFEPFERLNPLESLAYWSRLFGRSVPTTDLVERLRQVGLGERTRVAAGKLSGGEKRKLGIALALVNEPELLFLDEPTTGLDPRARRDVWAHLKRLREEGRTVFLTTHYLDEAERLADEVGVLHRGKLVALGSPQELIARHGRGTTIVLAGAGDAGARELEALGIPALRENDDVLVRVSGPEGMKDAMRRLSSLSTPFRDMYTRRGTLDDAFLALVGARMEEGVLQA